MFLSIIRNDIELLVMLPVNWSASDNCFIAEAMGLPGSVLLLLIGCNEY